MTQADKATTIAALRAHCSRGLVASSETLQFFTQREIEDALLAALNNGKQEARWVLERMRC